MFVVEGKLLDFNIRPEVLTVNLRMRTAMGLQKEFLIHHNLPIKDIPIIDDHGHTYSGKDWC